MEHAVRIRWNSLFSLLSSGIYLLTNALMFLGIARFYGPDSFGQFTTAHTLSTLFLLVADFGLDLLFTTEIAKRRSEVDRLFRSYVTIRLLFCAVAVLGMWLVSVIHDFSEDTRWLIYIFGFGVACNALTNFFFALFKGFEQLQHQTRVYLAENTVLLILLVLLGILHTPLWLFGAAYAGTRVLGLIVAATAATHFVRLRGFSLSMAAWQEVMRHGWIFGVHLLFGTLYFQLDTLLLAFWQGDHAVGIYQSVMKLVALALVLIDVLVNALLPVFARVYGEDEKKWCMLGRLLNKTLLLLGLPIALVFFVYAEQIIQILYGAGKFASAVPIMRIAALIIVIRFALETYGLMLTTSGRQYVRMIIVIMASIITFVMNSYAIPRYGAYGAAVVSLVTNLFVAVAFVLSSRRCFMQWFFDVRYLLPGILTLVLGIMLANVQNPWFSLPFALILYAFVFYFVGYTKAERQKVFIGKSWANGA